MSDRIPTSPARLAAAVTRLLEKSESEATRGNRESAFLFASKASEASRRLHELTLRAALDVALPERVAP